MYILHRLTIEHLWTDLPYFIRVNKGPGEQLYVYYVCVCEAYTYMNTQFSVCACLCTHHCVLIVMNA